MGAGRARGRLALSAGRLEGTGCCCRLAGRGAGGRVCGGALLLPLPHVMFFFLPGVSICSASVLRYCRQRKKKGAEKRGKGGGRRKASDGAEDGAERGGARKSRAVAPSSERAGAGNRRANDHNKEKKKEKKARTRRDPAAPRSSTALTQRARTASRSPTPPFSVSVLLFLLSVFFFFLNLWKTSPCAQPRTRDHGLVDGVLGGAERACQGWRGQAASQPGLAQ